MAKIKEVKWYAKNEFFYNEFHFWKDQEIKGLTDEQMKGLNDMIYSKSAETEMEIVEESNKKGDKK